jgi:hypothetical protein
MIYGWVAGSALAKEELPRLSPRPQLVAGVKEPHVDLGGTWRFNPGPPEGFGSEISNLKSEMPAGWSDIQVPGEWVMQGFTVEADKPAGYFRSFKVPTDWKGKRIKLRCDGVYSDGTVWINGKKAGRHLGGFTPFELDVTELVKEGENVISISVVSESVADKLASGSSYAGHPLGGITRKIMLFALPSIHLSKLHVATTFDAAFRDATLEVSLAVAAEGGAAASDVQAYLTLRGPDGREAGLTPGSIALKDLAGSIKIPVAGPAKWDSEHPNLYTLTIELKAAEKLLETVTQRVGFRQVEVRGNQMFVNNMPVKLRGICRHEADPLRGRSLAPGTWRKDAELFRAGNCNYIRTSHYPPAEEFIEACDELGLFVECEAPFCWASQTKLTPAEVPDLITRQQLEMLEAYRNHPSITQWSLANESGAFGEYFLPAAKALRQLDPTRLLVFSDMTGGGGEHLDISNNHYPGYCDAKYPGLEGPARYANYKQPMIFDEYCHLNSYNRLELATDPGLRDIWGLGLAGMWQNILNAQGCLGGAIWSGVDDTFFLPNGKIVGYGPWGPIDGWRRPKPEYWNMKKAYSPLAVKETSVPANQPVRLTVENHQTFTDLQELRFEWKCGTRSGTARSSSVPPGQTGILEIPVSDASRMLEVSAVSPSGLNIDVWHIALGPDPRTAPPVPAAKPGPVTLEKPAGQIIVRSASFSVTFDAATGMATAPFTGPDLLLLPRISDSPGGGMEAASQLFTNTCSNWKASAVTAETTADQGVTLRVEGTYAEAQGAYTFRFAKDGSLTLAYDFTVTEKGQCDPRQIGVVFRMPRESDTLTWRRNAKWSAYPDDHIGRAQGTATAFVKGVPISLLAGPRVLPTWSWSADATPNGSNDFRSTKMNVYEAALLSPSGHGLRLLADGSSHVRCWVLEDSANLLIAEYTNHGAPQFFTEHVIPARPLKAGSVVKGTLRMEVQ